MTPYVIPRSYVIFQHSRKVHVLKACRYVIAGHSDLINEITLYGGFQKIWLYASLDTLLNVACGE